MTLQSRNGYLLTLTKDGVITRDGYLKADIGQRTSRNTAQLETDFWARMAKKTETQIRGESKGGWPVYGLFRDPVDQETDKRRNIHQNNTLPNRVSSGNGQTKVWVASEIVKNSCTCVLQRKGSKPETLEK